MDDALSRRDEERHQVDSLVAQAATSHPPASIVEAATVRPPKTNGASAGTPISVIYEGLPPARASPQVEVDVRGLPLRRALDAGVLDSDRRGSDLAAQMQVALYVALPPSSTEGIRSIVQCKNTFFFPPKKFKKIILQKFFFFLQDDEDREIITVLANWEREREQAKEQEEETANRYY